ncbi:MAG: SIR2 family NAD-dependent protein deacylase, partial [Nitrososphaeraceae archaeon]
MSNNNNVDKLIIDARDYLLNSQKTVFLTGAGISKESGIPTFRESDGLWKKHDPTKLASLSAFLNNPTLVWEFFIDRQKLINNCHPNEAHKAISNIENLKKNSWILTQNIDGLHQRSGSKNIIELHGNIFEIICIHCDYTEKIDVKNIKFSVPPQCKKCGKILKPNVILFEESLNQEKWSKAVEIASTSDIMFIIGTSLNVGPANLLPDYARENNAVLIEINP